MEIPAGGFMDLAKRMSKLSSRQRELLERKLGSQGFDILKLPVTKTDQERDIPLSFGQERLWFIHQLDPHHSAYNLVRATKLEGNLNIRALDKSVNEILRRHDILRTIFVFGEGKPVQLVRAGLSLPLEIVDITKFCGEEQEQEVEQIIHAESSISFDLEKGPLLRVKLLKLSVREHVFLLVIHHIAADGTSIQVFIRELVRLYAAFSQGKESPLTELPIQYADYACWQRQWFGEGALNASFRKKQEAYWLEQFRGEIPLLTLPIDFPRPAVQDFAGDTITAHLDSDHTRALKAMTLRVKTTLYVVILSVLNIFLSKLSGQEDIVVGTPVAGRRHPDVRELIGMFVNTLALRNYPYHDKSFAAFLEEVKQRTLSAFENQEYRYEDIVNNIEVSRDTGRNPLFDVMFILKNVDYAEVNIPGLTLKHYRYESKTSKFDLTFTAWEEAGDTLGFNFEYCTALFKESTIRRFIDYFKQVVQGVVDDFDSRLSEIGIVPEEEKSRILYDFNQTQSEYPQEKTIHQLFREQVEKTPDHIALKGVYDLHKISVTYSELDRKSDGLACLLREKGVLEDRIAAIMMDRSIDMIIGILGILKAGGAYLPIDPGYPRERIDYMLKDSGAKILLTSLPEGRDIHHSSLITHHSGSLAYVIYTSGSTGKPKGVMIENRSVVNFIKGMTGLMDFRPDDRVLSLTTISFDIFAFETIVPLTSGFTVLLGTEAEQIDPAAALHTAARERVTIFQLTPSRLRLYLSHAKEEAVKCFSLLRYLLVGGEVFPGSLFKEARSIMRGKIFNLYAPSETTIYSTGGKLAGESSLNIGKPLINTRVYILDRYLNSVPIGVAGEIYIGGDGVARGYLNRPELTAEKFNRDLWDYQDYHDENQKLLRGVQGGGFLEKSPPGRRRHYKTGDLGRWLLDGHIDFLGRVDHQVKIRGYRIELTEIENRLMRHRGVNEAVAITREAEAGDKHLYAFYVPLKEKERTIELDPSVLREFLSAELPDYMIPSYFVPLERFPLTPSKKIDRKALLTYDGSRPQVKSAYLGPQTGLEKKVADCWIKVLKIDNVGLYDNFFEVGGNSFNIIQLNIELKNALGRDIPVVSLYRYLTISSFTRYLDEEESKLSPEAGPKQRIESLQRARTLFDSAVKNTMRARNARKK
jgi:amino acid adenylation domain-containing protein